MRVQLSEADRVLMEYLNQPAPEGAQFGVTRYLHGLYAARKDLREEFPDLDRDGSAFIEWVHSCGRVEVPIVDELLPPKPKEFHRFPPRPEAPDVRAPRDWGVNFVGFLQAEVGIGEAGRLIVSGLDARNVPLLPIEGTIRPNLRHEHTFESLPPAAAGFPINVISTNPFGLGTLVEEVGRPFFEDRFSIGYWWWETDGPLPFDWRTNFELLNEIWVASEYVADCLAPQLPMPVRAMKLPIEMPEVRRMSRKQLGLPSGFLFMFVFDYASTIKRKNPTAVLEAFVRAFAPGEGAALAIKCVNPQLDPDGHARLEAMAAAHPDVRIIDRYISPEEKNALIAACDCYVSLHRAEGFGLPAAEAMYLGKPVIATGYSGNLDFMTAANSHLVAYTTIGVGDGAWPYPPTGTWAEPEVDHAAALMRQVFSDPEASRALGTRAAEDIRRTHSPRAAGEAMERRLVEIATALALDPIAAEITSRRIDPQPAADLIARGPTPPPLSRLGPIGPPLRRLLLRALLPYTVHQRLIDEHLVGALRQAQTAVLEGAGAAQRVRELELRLAQTKAAELRARRAAPHRAHAAPEHSPSRNGGSANGGSANGSQRPAASNGASPENLERAAKRRAQIESVPFWWHSIDLGDGIVTPGKKGDMSVELFGLRMPDLADKDVLDIGAWDGYYSFEAERRGARRVVALDHFVWSIVMTRRDDGLLFDGVADITLTDAWQPDQLPGKRGFEIAHEALGSRVESIAADFMTADLEALGTFDVVLYLGVLYHMQDPLLALRRLAQVTREVAVIETEAIVVPGGEPAALCRFFSADQLAGDPTNWWTPNLTALHDMLHAAGFAHTETITGPPPQAHGGDGRYRAVVHAFK